MVENSATGTETGQTTQEPETQTQAETKAPDTPAGDRTFTEAEVAAARRDEQAKRKAAEKKAQDLETQLAELSKFREEVESERQQAADAEKSELQKALERMQKAQDEAKAAQQDAATAKRDALVAQVASEQAPGLPLPFLRLVEGDTVEDIIESIKAVEALGKQRWAPQDIGAGNPPSQTRTVDQQAQSGFRGPEYFKRLNELNQAAADPRNPEHRTAIQELAKLTGRA